MKNLYKLTGNSILGYGCSIKYWWFPFCYLTIVPKFMGFTKYQAEEFIKNHKINYENNSGTISSQ